MIIADLHTHSLVTNHAYNTITEMAKQGASIGLAAMAITDHGPAMPDAPHPWYFSNLTKELPFVMEGIPVLKGAEANILNEKGTLDFTQNELSEFDWVIASIHRPLLPQKLTIREANYLWSAIAENPWVDMIGHSEMPAYEYDYLSLTKLFAEKHKVVELNANSCTWRPEGKENMRRLALACKENGTPVAVNSDAHSIYRLGQTRDIFTMLEELDFPMDLVINTSKELLLKELCCHNHGVAEKLGGVWHE